MAKLPYVPFISSPVSFIILNLYISSNACCVWLASSFLISGRAAAVFEGGVKECLRLLGLLPPLLLLQVRELVDQLLRPPWLGDGHHVTRVPYHHVGQPASLDQVAS